MESIQSISNNKITNRKQEANSGDLEVECNR